MTYGLLSKEYTPNEVVVQVMEERWQDKTYELEAENEKLRIALKALIKGTHHEICEGRVSHECEECSMSRSREGCIMTDVMDFFNDDEMCELLVAQTIERGSYEQTV